MGDTVDLDSFEGKSAGSWQSWLLRGQCLLSQGRTTLFRDRNEEKAFAVLALAEHSFRVTEKFSNAIVKTGEEKDYVARCLRVERRLLARARRPRPLFPVVAEDGRRYVTHTLLRFPDAPEHIRVDNEVHAFYDKQLQDAIKMKDPPPPYPELEEHSWHMGLPTELEQRDVLLGLTMQSFNKVEADPAVLYVMHKTKELMTCSNLETHTEELKGKAKEAKMKALIQTWDEALEKYAHKEAAKRGDRRDPAEIIALNRAPLNDARVSKWQQQQAGNDTLDYRFRNTLPSTSKEELDKAIPKLCSWCNESSKYRSLKLCARCRKTTYCCREHQKLHYKSGHKEECKKPQGKQI